MTHEQLLVSDYLHNSFNTGHFSALQIKLKSGKLIDDSEITILFLSHKKYGCLQTPHRHTSHDSYSSIHYQLDGYIFRFANVNKYAEYFTHLISSWMKCFAVYCAEGGSRSLSSTII